MIETQDVEKKSIKILGSDLSDVVQTFVSLANARGGKVLIGIEDKDDQPPADQIVRQKDIDKVNKRIGELTYNVGISPIKVRAENGGEYIEVKVFPSKSSIASTCDGRYYMRVGDKCSPILPGDLDRLYSDRGSYIWELRSRNVPCRNRDEAKSKRLVDQIRLSERVSEFIKNKSEEEIMDYFHLSLQGELTNLGVMWVGTREDRARLNYPPTIQFIKYDEQEKKTKKLVWTDCSLNPLELVEAVWNEVDDWREFYELPDGIFRQNIPHYDESIVRELLINALIHRPYNIRGDIYINLYSDRLEITNPGILPLGVTPQNILHTRQHRNRELCNLCYYLKLMEKEGSGYDMIYEKLLTSGKPLPEVIEGIDSVTVKIFKRVIDNRIVELLSSADQRFELTQREKITLGIIAQTEAIQVLDLTRVLNLPNAKELDSWLGKLKAKGLIVSASKTKGTTYLLNPEFIKKVGFKGNTTLKGIERHRLRELILTDLRRNGTSTINEISNRVGNEIPIRRIRSELSVMVKERLLLVSGKTRWSKYLLPN